MTLQATCIRFNRASFLLLCGLSGALAFQGGCAVVGSPTGSDGAMVSGGVAQVCIGCSAIPPETITQLKAQGITEAALDQFFTTLGRNKTSPEALDHELRDIAKNYLDLKTKIATFSSEDPEVTALIQGRDRGRCPRASVGRLGSCEAFRQRGVAWQACRLAGRWMSGARLRP